MLMRPTDPPPTLDLTAPEVENACLRIALELEEVKREYPDWPHRAQLQEARRRSAQAMLDAIEASDHRKPAENLG
jgi:hypothetical protein